MMSTNPSAAAPPFGPVLYFRGAEADAWRLAAVVGVAGDTAPGPLVFDDRQVAPERLTGRRGVTVWRYDFGLARGAEPRATTYRIGDRAWPVTVPGADGLRIAFCSCNGSEEGDFDRPETLPDRNAMWLDLHRAHRNRPFHLLLQGGDQLYADKVWEKAAPLAALMRERRYRRQRAPFDRDMARAVGDFYFERYALVWSQSGTAEMLASVPSLMMWDDHDIFDGWGSHPPQWQGSSIYQGVFRQAAEQYRLFQFGMRPGEAIAGLTTDRARHTGWCHRIGDIGIVAPDLRSTRLKRQVMETESWDEMEDCLDRLAGCRQLVFLSTVPLVNVDLRWLERIFAIWPGRQKYQDDLRDQWQSYAHRAEWLRALTLLFDFAERNGATVLIVSGEIHMAAVGRARRGAVSLWQFIASGIAHPPLPSLVLRVLGWLARRRGRPGAGIETEMLPFPGGDGIYCGARNWLALELGSGTVNEVRWHVEGAPEQGRLDLRGL